MEACYPKAFAVIAKPTPCEMMGYGFVKRVVQHQLRLIRDEITIL